MAESILAVHGDNVRTSLPVSSWFTGSLEGFTCLRKAPLMMVPVPTNMMVGLVITLMTEVLARVDVTVV